MRWCGVCNAKLSVFPWHLPKIIHFPATKLQQQLSTTLQKTHYHRFCFCHTTPPVVTCIDVEENEAKRKILQIYFTFHACPECIRDAHQVRRSAQVLRSFGKQTAHPLLTFLLIIKQIFKNEKK
jgi:hypothetical protein